jgi:hypothetical protein
MVKTSQSSNVHLVLNSRDRGLPGGTGVYNNFSLSNVGQNILQGQTSDIRLGELLFPYDLPNVMPGYNTFTIVNLGTPDYDLVITITPSFYTGAELATQINAAIVAAGAAASPAIVSGDLPTCAYNAITNQFFFAAPVSPSDPRFEVWNFLSPYLNPGNLPVTQYSNIGKDLLSIMGYSRGGSFAVSSASGNEFDFVSGSAPLVFTQYIDICSPKLCQYQFVRDGNTAALARRVDLAARVYIEDETSMPIATDASGNPIPTGTRPFVIHRQFTNSRVFRWTAGSAVNAIDIQLYDDVGQPLATAWLPRDFQITFHVYEGGDHNPEHNVGYRF